jgi:hypothetical protein
VSTQWYGKNIYFLYNFIARILNLVDRAYFGYLDPRVTFCLSARLADTPKLGLAPHPNPSSGPGAFLERVSDVSSSVFGRFWVCEQ